MMSLQNGNTIRVLHGHILISGIIHCHSGLLIGGSTEALEIGGIDRSVIRNPLDGHPYIPGSSLKGKLRSIMEKIVRKDGNPLIAKRPGGDKEGKVWRHECNDFSKAKNCPLCRVFGATGYSPQGEAETNDNYPAALLVRDGNLSNIAELEQDGLPITEIKMENAIDRLTSAAHPRTFERVPAGAEFEFELVYRVETLSTNGTGSEKEVNYNGKRVGDDINNILTAMDILEKDGLGGNISRGYGRIEFLVKEFQGYDINGNSKGGFKCDKGKSVNDCKSKRNDIEFIKKSESKNG